ncbi:MAG: hypothetical protein ISS76_20670 [Phycisphaerae bacterium]|nr:hypothetical protein [Phycisphaerae bacterium]
MTILKREIKNQNVKSKIVEALRANVLIDFSTALRSARNDGCVVCGSARNDGCVVCGSARNDGCIVCGSGRNDCYVVFGSVGMTKGICS